MIKFRFQDLKIWDLAIKKDFKQFLNVARRSTFENANILILLEKKKLIKEVQLEKLLDQLDHLCRQITNFQNYLVTASRS